MKYTSAFLAAAVLAGAYGQMPLSLTTLPPGGTGAISGTVADETGKPVSGAIATIASELPEPVQGQKPAPFTPFRITAVTANDGSYSGNYLPSGLFRICAQIPNSDYIAACRWPLPPTTATLATGQTPKIAAISLAKGFRLQIRLNDPAGILPTGTVWPGLNLGVFSQNTLFVPAQRVANDAAGFDYQVLVLFDLQLYVSASSKVLTLTDGAGNPGDALNRIITAVKIASGTVTAPVITVAIAGIKP
jgi:hypothetical protein